MTRWLAGATVLGVVATSGCAAERTGLMKGAPRAEHVTRHYVVLVTEQDPLAPPEQRAVSIVRHPVAGGPLTNPSDDAKAFAMRDPRYDVRVAWKGDCLDVAVSRRGLSPWPDFDAHGCVRPDGPDVSVARVGPSDAPIRVELMLFGDPA